MLKSIVAAAALLAAGAPLAAQEADWTEVRARRQAGAIESVTVDLEYVAGELRVGPADGGLLYDTHLKYDAARMRPERSWSVNGNAARLDLGFEGLGDDGDMDIDFEGDEHGFLELGLSQDVPTDLRIAAGAALSEVNLTGIPLTGLVYKTGASDTEISIGSPNPVRMEHLEMAVGAAEFSASGLGNARFEELTFTGGVANNGAAVDALHELVRENYGELQINISPDSIYTGALGAAIFALRDVQRCETLDTENLEAVA